MSKLTFLVGALAVLRLVGHFTDPILTGAQIHRIVGEPARVTGTSPRSTMRVVTWNIEQGVRFDEIARQLRHFNADVVLLQEADIACRRSGYRNVPRELAHMLELNWVAAGEFQEIGESSRGVPALTTQAILSRFPIAAPTTIRFAKQALLRWKLSPVQPRRGARVALKARIGDTLIYNAHIESGGNETLRTAQIQQILEDYKDSRADARGALVAGDFNNIPSARSPIFPALAEGGFHNALERTLPTRTSAGNKHPIDWIFVRGFTAGGGVVDTGDASDHFAVVAEITTAESRLDAHERLPGTETTRIR